MKVFWTIGFLFFTQGGFAQGPKVLTLDECIQIALRQNPEVALSKLSVRQAEDTHVFSKQNQWPTATSNVSQSVFGGRSIDPFSNTFVQQSITSNAFGLGVNVPVFNGFSVKNQIEQNRLLAEVSKQNLAGQLKIIKIETIRAYFQVVLALDLQRIQADQIDEVQSQRLILQEKIKEGIASAIQLKELDAQLSNLAFEALELRQSLQQAQLNLAQIMGYSENKEIQVEKPRFVHREPTGSVAKHPILKAFQFRMMESNIGLATARATAYPRVSLGAGLNTAYSSAASGDISYWNQLNFNFNQFANLSISIPLFNSSQTKQKVAQAQIQIDVVKKEWEKEHLRLKQEVERLRLEIQILGKKVQQAQENQRIQQEIYGAIKERFSEGMVSLLELNAYRLTTEKAASVMIRTEADLAFKKQVLQTFLEEE